MDLEISKLLDVVIRYNASDLHLQVGAPPRVRIDGTLRDLGKTPLGAETTAALMKSITSERHQQELNEVGGADFGFHYNDRARFRVSVFKEKQGLGISLRLIPSQLMSFEEIGLPPVIKDMCLRQRGLVLVTGPTGSGKTTTLATMINFVNEERHDHIVTIEDPIEYYHDHKNCLVTQRELGNHVPSFSEALRRGLRMDPDVMLVGEMRDLETIAAAITAAETGHLVFATLHTTGAADTIDRIVDAFPTNQQEQIRIQLAETLIAVISQALMPRLDPTDPEGKRVKGRIAAFELMFCNDAIRALIRKAETFKIDSHIQTGGREGMILLDDFLFNLWVAGKISYAEMMRRSQNPLQLENKVREYQASRPRRR